MQVGAVSNNHVNFLLLDGWPPIQRFPELREFLRWQIIFCHIFSAMVLSCSSILLPGVLFEH